VREEDAQGFYITRDLPRSSGNLEAGNLQWKISLPIFRLHIFLSLSHSLSLSLLSLSLSLAGARAARKISCQ